MAPLAVVLALALAQDAPAAPPGAAPSWAELDRHPTPEWYRDARFGVFVHWGVYSVPAFADRSTYAEWYRYWLETGSHDGLVRRFHDAHYGPDFRYEDFAPLFRAELFDPAEWADLFRRSGARYVVLTAKHHDGYCLWPAPAASEVRGHPWTAPEVGPRRDLVGELTEAVRAAGLRMGLYYSFLEWGNPLLDADPARYVDEVLFPQVQDLVLRYQPDVFWPDGEWQHPDDYWRSRELLAWVRANAPNAATLAVNDRWGQGLRGAVGDFSTTEYGSLGGGAGLRADRPFEECRGIGHSFGYNRAERYDDYLSREACVRLLVETAARGGNLLLDVGPTADGRIPLLMQDRLLAIGRWLEVNGEAVYGTEAGPLRRQPWGRSTVAGDRLFLHVMEWPADGRLVVRGLETPVRRAVLLAAPDDELATARDADGALVVRLPAARPCEPVSVVALDLEGPPRVREWLGPDPDGVLRLRADAAEVSGPSLRLESFPDADGRPVPNLGYWTDPAAEATWRDVRLPDASALSLTLDYACAPGQEGGELELTFRPDDGEPYVLRVPIAEPTASWRDFARLGPFPLPPTLAGRRLTLTARAAAIPAEALMNLRALAITPR